MIDIKEVRNNPERVRESIKKRNISFDLDAFLLLDEKRRELIVKVDDLRAIKNKVSKEIPTLSNEERPQKIAEMKALGDELSTLESQQKEINAQWEDGYYRLPNFLDPTAAVGDTDEDNVQESVYGEKPKFDFTVKPHYEIGEKKNWIHMEKGSQVSGSRFWYLTGDLVSLQYSLVNFAMQKLQEKGFSPIIPPVMVKEKAMYGTGFLPAGEDGLYRVNPSDDDLHLVGTSEVPVTSFHMDEIIDVTEAKKYFAYTPCFRKEAGSAGKDTRGILRGHQFDKIEMVVFCDGEESQKMHDFMVGVEEEIWQALKIPYQKMNVCSGDLGNPAMKKYDLEAWMPAQDTYREVTSCSNVGDYQSRRLNIKHIDANGESQFVHTLNGTVIALGRCLIAIMENYQTQEGNVAVPEVLQAFMGGKKEI